MKKFKPIIAIFFLLIFLELMIIELKEVSLIRMLELGSVALVIILYYFIVRTEVRYASKIIEEKLLVVERRFENIERRFDEDINELKELLKKGALRSIKRKR